ncbi:MAG: type II toxin-antitoxin system VapC family toxin [Bacteroidota bacterium]
MPTKYRLQDFPNLAGKDIFFDANILIYLYWPTGDRTYEDNYATTFSNLFKQGNNLYIDFLVISEIVNTVIRIEHQRVNPSMRFKAFRNSQEGKEALNDIYLIIKDEILHRFNIIESSYNNQKIESFLTVDELDFVDKALVSICLENNLVLLTHDRDFKNSGLDILTGNPRILN